MGQPRPVFVYFRHFQTLILRKNCLRQRDSNSDRQTQGKHADHLTTSTAQVDRVSLHLYDLIKVNLYLIDRDS